MDHYQPSEPISLKSPITHPTARRYGLGHMNT